jgi:hypothetical protein
VQKEKATAATPAKQLAGFLAKYDAPIAKLAMAARAKLRKRMPTAVEMIYDNYNALVLGFCPNDRPSDAICSLALFPEWVTLCFIQGVKLADPKQLLRTGEHGDPVHLRQAAAAAAQARRQRDAVWRQACGAWFMNSRG